MHPHIKGATGGGYYARFELLTKWLPSIIEEVMVNLKVYISSIDPNSITDLFQE